MFRSICLGSLFFASTVVATPTLFDFQLNVDGEIYTTNAMWPSKDVSTLEGLDLSDFNLNTGLGTISFNYGPGNYENSFLALYLNLDIDPDMYENDFVSAIGLPSTGLSYSAGVSESVLMDNFYSNSYDQNAASGMSDVAVAMRWDNLIAKGGVISFTISDIAPVSGLYLSQSNGSETVYFSSKNVPEPGCLALLIPGLACLGLFQIRRKNKVTTIA